MATTERVPSKLLKQILRIIFLFEKEARNKIIPDDLIHERHFVEYTRI